MNRDARTDSCMQFVGEIAIESTSIRGKQIKRARASAEEMATSWSSPEKNNHRSRTSFKKTMDGLLLSFRGKTRSRVGSPDPVSAIADPHASALSLEELVPESQIVRAQGGSGRKLLAAPVSKREGGKSGGGRTRHPEAKWKDSLLKARLALRVKREKKKAKHAKLSEARNKLCTKKNRDWEGDGVEEAEAHPTSSDDISQLEFPFKRPSVEELRAFAKTILNDGLVYRLIEH